jgi:hypothetical protein
LSGSQFKPPALPVVHDLLILYLILPSRRSKHSINTLS